MLRCRQEAAMHHLSRRFFPIMIRRNSRCRRSTTKEEARQIELGFVSQNRLARPVRSAKQPLRLRIGFVSQDGCRTAGSKWQLGSFRSAAQSAAGDASSFSKTAIAVRIGFVSQNGCRTGASESNWVRFAAEQSAGGTTSSFGKNEGSRFRNGFVSQKRTRRPAQQWVRSVKSSRACTKAQAADGGKESEESGRDAPILGLTSAGRNRATR
jgi:hypothetical protein